jgi:putative DNA primase/helicase
MIEIAFRKAMTDAGLITDDAIIGDGKLRRIHIKGDKPSSKSGWYVLFADGVPSGAFGNWKGGIKGSWCQKGSSNITALERKENLRRIKVAKIAAQKENIRSKAEASQRALKIWDAAIAADDNHAYLTRKKVRSHGLRISQQTLIIPMHDETGKLCSLQFIQNTGFKRFLKGGKVIGCFYILGKVRDMLCIAEGYATAASVHESTGNPVAISFSANNLKPAAEALRRLYPKCKIIVCADDDEIGIQKAKEAAIAIDGFLAVPARKAGPHD